MSAPKDHLETETAVAVAVTESGLEAKAKSRTVSAVDRLCGNLIDQLNPALEKRTAIKRAKADAELQIIQATSDLVAERLAKDPKLAARAIQNYVAGILRSQENKDAVVIEAHEQLKLSPPSTLESEQGADRLDETFLSRVERYAETASTDELRQRWGRVLASEIRKPGTFTARVLRIVDELHPETAQLFEKFCANRFGRIVPRCIAIKLRYQQVQQLVESGLLIDPAVGQELRFGSFKHTYQTDGGADETKEYWSYCLQDDLGIIFSEDISLENYKGEEGCGFKNRLKILDLDDGKLRLPTYALTEVGEAISSILQYTPLRNALDLRDWIARNYEVSEIQLIAPNNDGSGRWHTFEPDPDNEISANS